MEWPNPDTGAAAVAEAFRNWEYINVDLLPEIIERVLSDESGRHDEAGRLSKELQRMDYVWNPPGLIMAEPGIPGFMTFAQSVLEARQRDKKELFTEDDRPERNDNDLDWER